MSGGVDSSVAALLLVQAGFEACGITMKLFERTDLAPALAEFESEKSCCSLDDVEDARQAARMVGIDHLTLNLKDAFARDVMDRFCAGYLGGRTPNPCIDCNRYMKFEALGRRRRELGYDYLATGHYVRREWSEERGRFLLRRARDLNKDQSYVLYHLTQEDLAHYLFPLGELTKAQTRELAAEHGFVTAQKPESQDICFVPDGDYAGFIRHRCGAQFEPGPIVDEAGRVLGQHRGLIHYTAGQRRGIGVAAAEPLFVLAKRSEENALVVGPREALMVHDVWASEVNLIAVDALDEPMRVTAKTGYRQTPQPGWAQVEDGRLHMHFDEPHTRTAAGQALVLYDGDVVVGGGTICE